LEDVADMQRADYQEAWAWVHFMLQGSPDAKRELLGYLQSLRSAANPEPLSTRLLAGQTDQPERLLNYIVSLNTYPSITATF
jgi:hypothetical protein